MASFKLGGRFSEISMGVSPHIWPTFVFGMGVSDHPHVAMFWEVIPSALGWTVGCWIIGTIPSPYGPLVGVEPGSLVIRAMALALVFLGSASSFAS
jgi:hypothetical protein